MAVVSDLFRYPIKGLSAEPQPELTLSRDQGLPHDREYALALGTTQFDPLQPAPLDKGLFLMLRNNETLAALSTRLDPQTSVLTISRKGSLVLQANLSDAAGRDSVERFFEAYIGPAAKGRPRLVRADGHKFTDVSVRSATFMRAVSVINLASVQALEAATGQAVHPLRFRGNIYLEGLAPWEELTWADRELAIGTVRFRGLLGTTRCPAIDVNPQTAERDSNLPRALKLNFGHVQLGVYLETLGDGMVRVGDSVSAPVAVG